MLQNLQNSGIKQFYVGAHTANVGACNQANTGTLVTVSQITAITASGDNPNFTFYLGASTKVSNTNTNNPPNCNPAKATAATSFGIQQISADPAGTVPLFPINSVFLKAGWNAHLIRSDDSNGIHNPSFVTAVLNNTLAALQKVAQANQLQ